MKGCRTDRRGSQERYCHSHCGEKTSSSFLKINFFHTSNLVNIFKKSQALHEARVPRRNFSNDKNSKQKRVQEGITKIQLLGEYRNNYLNIAILTNQGKH